MDDRQAAYLSQCRSVIAEHGWMVQGVFPTTVGEVGFSYTVGMTPAGLPELLIAGLNFSNSGVLLNLAVERHLKQEIEAGDVLDSIANVAFRVVPAPAAKLGVAKALYGQVRALQLVWPAENGSYPGDKSWPHGMDAQPLFES